MMLSILVAYLCAFRGPISSKVFSSRCFVIVGGMCYSIYLYHYALISAIGRIITVPESLFWNEFNIALLINAIVFIPMIIGCSTLLYVTFEKPFMSSGWQGRLWNSLFKQRAYEADASRAENPTK